LPPFSRFTSAFRTELARLLPERVVFQEVSLDAEQTGTPEDERPFVEFLRARYGSSRPELIVTLGAPATHVYLRHRERLFRDVPLLVTGVEQRLGRRMDLGAGDFLVGVRTDIPRIVESILQVLTDTRTRGIIWRLVVEDDALIPGYCQAHQCPEGETPGQLHLWPAQNFRCPPLPDDAAHP
jgi:hypothetical protein